MPARSLISRPSAANASTVPALSVAAMQQGNGVHQAPLRWVNAAVVATVLSVGASDAPGVAARADCQRTR